MDGEIDVSGSMNSAVGRGMGQIKDGWRSGYNGYNGNQRVPCNVTNESRGCALRLMIARGYSSVR